MQIEILRLHLLQALVYGEDRAGLVQDKKTEDWIEVYQWENLIAMGENGPALRPEVLGARPLFIGIKDDNEAKSDGAQGEYRLKAGIYAFAQVRPAPTEPAEAILAFCRRCWWEGALSKSQELGCDSELCLRHVREDGAWSLQMLINPPCQSA